MRVWYFLAVCTFMMSRSYAQQNAVSNDIISQLQTRENAFNGRELDWHLTQTTVQPSDNPVAVARIKKQLPAQILRDLKKDYGVTDPKAAQKYVDARVAAAINNPYQVTASSFWHWVNDGKTTEVRGMVQDSPSLATTFVYYFSKDWGMYVNTDSVDPRSGKKIYLNGPSLWNSRKGVLVSPVPNAPYLRPADGAFLFGRNPLDAYKAEWKVASKTSNAVVLNAEIDTKNSRPLKLHLILDPLHGMAPLRLEEVRGRQKSIYQSTKFRLEDHVWLTEQVLFSFSYGDGFLSNLEWNLTKTRKALPVIVSLAKGEEISDYRLLDADMSVMDVLDEQQRSDSRVVSYKWTGEPLNRQQLQGEYHQLHPGEDTSDPSQSGSVPPGLSTAASRASLINLVLPFLGGLLLIVGGVWMFKQRKAN